MLSGQWFGLCFYTGMDAGGTATTECPPKEEDQSGSMNLPTSVAERIKLRDFLRIASTCLILLSIVFPSLPRPFAVADSGQIAEFTVGAAADYYADSMYPKSAYGNRPVLYVGNSYDRAQNLSGLARIYIQFDLSMIPRHARVVSAEMSLYQMYAPASGLTLDTHIVQSAWNESTMNWNTQPSSDAAVISAAQAPAIKDVWVSWNVTSAVQSWVNGDTANYGFMIRIQNEKTGVANEASGFYSRQYPGAVKPKVHILCASHPPFTYVFPTRVNGLPSNLTSVITADNGVAIKVTGGGVGYFLFESGTIHRIIADEYVAASDSTRYHASTHSATAATEGEFAVTYNPQFRITVKSEPPGLIEPESSNWYDAGARVTTPTAQEAFDEGPSKRTVFKGWYVNDLEQTGNPFEYVVAVPANLTARFTVMYNVNVSSPFGQVSGSGWHDVGSSVEITVEPSYLPVEGFLGYLGFGTSFDHWTGTVESTSSAVKVTVDGPIEEKAAWREDRSRLLAGVAVIIGLLVVLTVLRRVSRHSGSRESTGRLPPKSKASFERPAIAKSSLVTANKTKAASTHLQANRRHLDRSVMQSSEASLGYVPGDTAI